MPRHTRILIVDDESYICDILQKALEIDGFEPTTTTDSRQVVRLTEQIQPDLILLDITMPGLDGLEVLEALQKKGIDVPVVMMTGYSSMETTVKAIRLGAKDYLTKPLDIMNIGRIISRWVEEDSARRAKPVASQPASRRERIGMIGSSAGMIEVYKVIGAVSKTPNNTNVLILGESGTGKELVARQVHDFGDHANSPYIALNMTALTDTLIESELFGYEKGAFTGAAKQQPGQFELAGDGTIFLDEIGGISAGLQQKLLRVLQEREFRRVGGQSVLPVRCRIIAATNANLAAQAASGDFRPDLYHRLNVISIKIPSLRERVDDIPRLVEYFIAEKCHELGRALPILKNQTIVHLCRYPWPGNVRELRNTISRALILNRSDTLREDDFGDLTVTNQPELAEELPEDLATARKIHLESFERSFIIESLRKHNGNVTEAAANAKITPQRFYEMMRKYEIKNDPHK